MKVESRAAGAADLDSIALGEGGLLRAVAQQYDTGEEG